MWEEGLNLIDFTIKNNFFFLRIISVEWADQNIFRTNIDTYIMKKDNNLM